MLWHTTVLGSKKSGEEGLCGGWVLQNLNMSIWLVVKIMVPFWVPIIIRPLIFRVPKKGP